MIRWSTSFICSANASALSWELLNAFLNASNWDNTSGGKMLFAALVLNRDEKAPVSPNRLPSFRTLLNLSILSLMLSIGFPNIANFLFFVVNIILLGMYAVGTYHMFM